MAADLKVQRLRLEEQYQRYVENPLSKRILAGEFQEGDAVEVDVGADGLAFAKEGVTAKARK